MCGITGIFDATGQLSKDDLVGRIGKMTESLFHRGPDDDGVWFEVNCPLALGHRRLSILDLSDSGRQPMISHSGRFVLVYNGEIYNHKQLKEDLDKVVNGIRWRGHSDTELLLEAIEYWGLDDIVNRLNGMFAFALWDRKKKILRLVRDRLGKKPLYYGWNEGCFVFSSELKGIRSTVGSYTVNKQALAFLLRQNFIPSPHSIVEGIYKLPAACILSLPLKYLGKRSNFSPFPRQNPVVGMPYYFWNIKNKIIQSWQKPLKMDLNQTIDQLDQLLMDSVGLRMEADVPIGAFLSGGIDSSLVTAFMQKLSPTRVQTYSIGFQNSGNEAEYAKAVADFLGTEHTELYVSPELLLDQIPSLPAISDEPIGDTAVIPTYLLSRLTRQSVTVALSGDGGDELFAGYPRYIWTKQYWERARKRVAWMPTLFRKMVMRGVRELPEQLFDFFPYGSQLEEMSKTLIHENPEDIYHFLIDHWRGNLTKIVGAEPNWSVMTGMNDWPDKMDVIQRMVYLDLVGRLPDSIVSKVDRATMQMSLEARCPLMDYRLVDLAMKIPTHFKIQNGQGKWILRQLLYRYVPKSLVDRPKAGFKTPISEWLRGPLREWAEDLLTENRIKKEGHFEPKIIRKKWKEHLSGEKEHHYELWNVLMFQAWLEYF